MTVPRLKAGHIKRLYRCFIHFFIHFHPHRFEMSRWCHPSWSIFLPAKKKSWRRSRSVPRWAQSRSGRALLETKRRWHPVDRISLTTSQPLQCNPDPKMKSHLNPISLINKNPFCRSWHFGSFLSPFAAQEAFWDGVFCAAEPLLQVSNFFSPSH